MATLPPGVSSADFSTALGQFAEAVGPDWVFSSDEDVALYRDAYSPFWGEETESQSCLFSGKQKSVITNSMRLQRISRGITINLVLCFSGS